MPARLPRTRWSVRPGSPLQSANEGCTGRAAGCRERARKTSASRISEFIRAEPLVSARCAFMARGARASARFRSSATLAVGRRARKLPGHEGCSWFPGALKSPSTRPGARPARRSRASLRTSIARRATGPCPPCHGVASPVSGTTLGGACETTPIGPGSEDIRRPLRCRCRADPDNVAHRRTAFPGRAHTSSRAVIRHVRATAPPAVTDCHTPPDGRP